MLVENTGMFMKMSEMDHVNRCIELKCPKMASCSEIFCERTNDVAWRDRRK